MKKNILALAIVALGLGVASCDSYLDINDNPNSPTEKVLDTSMIFPGAELNFANQYGCRLRVFGGFYAEYYTQLPGTSNYQPMAGFTQAPSLSNSVYRALCINSLNNLNIVRNISKEKQEWGSYLAATVLRVATYQIFIDSYAAIPYFEGMDINNTAPHYDEGEVVYPELVKELDEALNQTSAGDQVCTNFLFQGETASNWIKVANALKLRLLMRMSGVADVKTQLADLVKEGNFPAKDAKWSGFWQNAAGSTNPFYFEEFYPGRQNNVCLNTALMRTFEDAEDARLSAWWNPNASGNMQSWVSSATGITNASQYYNSAAYSRPKIDYASPVYFITVAETEFFLAEYYQRFVNNSAEAKAHYEAAVKASFATAGLSEADATTVLDAYPYADASAIRTIAIQKWVHLSGTNTFEGYCELRRLKNPTFGDVQGTDIYDFTSDTYTPSKLPAATLYTPIQVNAEIGANKLLQRWPFPSSSASANANVPSFAGYTTPIFWAK